MEWLNLLKSKVASVWEDRKVKQKEKWTINIEKDFITLSNLLNTQLKNKVSYNKQANELLADNIEYLKIAKFYYQDEQSQLIAKDLMLKLWDNLIKTMDIIATGSIYNYYKALIFLIRRNEFGPSCIKSNNTTNKLEISLNDEKICVEYRKMLFQTQEWVQEKISPEEIIDPLTKSVKRVKRTPTYLFSSFVANVLAINSFHIPEMLDSFIKIISAETMDSQEFLGEWMNQVTPSEWRGDFSSSFESKHPTYIDPYIAKDLKESIDDYDKDLLVEFPSLFQWKLFHKMIAKKNDNLYERFSQNQQNWCDVIDIESGIYFLFLKAWVEHVQFVVEETGKKKVDWKRIVGFKTFVRGFLYGMKKSKQLNRMIQDCSVTLLSCEPVLIDFYIKVCFTTTNVHDLTSLLDTLTNLEMWLRCLKKNATIIPNTFDHTFFCKGLDIIFEHDHHVPISKVLSLLFNFSELFGDEARRAIYGNLLIQKYFFRFFLHWDIVIRSTFHQLLVFRCLRNKRKDIRGVQSKSEYFRNPQFEVDTVLFSKIESHVRMVKEHQKDKKHSNLIPVSLECYIPRAIVEYRSFLEKYQVWESGNSPLPNLVSYQQKEYKV